MTLRAFHGKQAVKTKYLNRVKMRRELDNIIQGTGWSNGKGCAVGCTLENYDHQQYEVELGIPAWLAQVEDTIFEGLSEKKALLWPEKFLAAIKPGANLEAIKKPFVIFILKESLKSIGAVNFDKKKFPYVKKAIDETKTSINLMIKYHRTGKGLDAAAYSAASAARSAASAARSAAYEKFAKKLLALLKAAK